MLLYALCCSVQGRLKAVLLCLRYVDTAAVAFGGWFVPSWCAQKKQAQKQNVVVCVPRRLCLAELMIQLWQCLSNKSTSPAVRFTSRLVLPSAKILGLRRAPACVANMLRSLTPARAVMVLLYCGCGAATTTAA